MILIHNTPFLLHSWMIRVRYTDETVDASGYDLPGTQHITYTFSGPAIVSPDQLYTLTTDEHERSTHDEVWEIQDDSLDVWAYRTVYLELLDADKLLVSTAVVRQCARRE
ncbi:hypothetical protein SARC_07948 [Sphaeroforma arctica JP610]|uniref:Uncharacterized protein n=1 Tax=Sphaeroforma arctica JP610 TaxID=667725 RepID=A0A0L0FUR2_9EUKA|nr:hypothetical protein SARC_07948 [Sphaeroforma arctica JP610]KNC79668.1 hypothetical protein SARC_07948 [Sphaeroforma arctica JP610]|eukprot:XP_014153570.1 hypothetical protein SARC_07948 [Sphaeroforma arctica JP610]